jgi:hypothetical protein
MLEKGWAEISQDSAKKLEVFRASDMLNSGKGASISCCGTQRFDTFRYSVSVSDLWCSLGDVIFGKSSQWQVICIHRGNHGLLCPVNAKMPSQLFDFLHLF